MTTAPALVIAVAVAGVGGGLFLLVRGLVAYRAGEPVRGTSTSRIESLAAGEVRLVGTIEPGPVTLVSPLQSLPCVYYHARILEDRGRGESVATLDEERAVGFVVHDATGRLRVFPRGARWDVPARFDERSDWTGGDPPGLNLNRGPGVTSSTLDREAAIEALLTVQAPGGDAQPRGILDGGALAALTGSHRGGMAEAGFGEMAAGLGGSRRRYEEHCLAAGDTVTIVGIAVPFGDIDDPATADRLDPTVALDDPEVAMNIAEARRAGLLKGSPAEAWGNAAIPGFGIGLPARRPELDPAARQPSIAPAGAEAAADATFDIPPGELVLAAGPGNQLVVRLGSPVEAVARDRDALLLGLLGAVIAIAGGLVLALAAQGALR